MNVQRKTRFHGELHSSWMELYPAPSRQRAKYDPLLTVVLYRSGHSRPSLNGHKQPLASVTRICREDRLQSDSSAATARAGPIYRARTGLAIPKKIVTPWPPQRMLPR